MNIHVQEAGWEKSATNTAKEPAVLYTNVGILGNNPNKQVICIYTNVPDLRNWKKTSDNLAMLISLRLIEK